MSDDKLKGMEAARTHADCIQPSQYSWSDLVIAFEAGIAWARAHPAPPDRPLSPAEWGEQVFARPEEGT
jgi:hypothetical protein